jgi:hypothetical protein
MREPSLRGSLGEILQTSRSYGSGMQVAPARDEVTSLLADGLLAERCFRGLLGRLQSNDSSPRSGNGERPPVR